MNQIEVQIMGQGYILSCPQADESALRQAAAQVDEAMCRIRDAGKIRARDRIAVLAALNLAFDAAQSTPAASADGGTPTTPDAAPPLAPDATAPSDRAQDAQRVQHLIERLDRVLASDGQLL